MGKGDEYLFHQLSFDSERISREKRKHSVSSNSKRAQEVIFYLLIRKKSPSKGAGKIIYMQVEALYTVIFSKRRKIKTLCIELCMKLRAHLRPTPFSMGNSGNRSHG